MTDIKSLLPPYWQTAVDDLSYVSKDIYVLTPAYFTCRQIFRPAAMPLLAFSAGLISTKLVIKHFSTYSNAWMASLKKCIRPLSERLLLVRTITAIATIILYQATNKGPLIMMASGVFFGLLHPVKDLDRQTFDRPKKAHLDPKRDYKKEIS